MTPFQITAILISLAALLSYVNHRLLKLPAAIGMMVLAMCLSLGILMAGIFFPGVQTHATAWLSQIDFNAALMDIMLGYLLFAGSLHINLNDLANQKLIVAVLATAGLLICTGLIGGMIFGVCLWMGIQLPLIYCFLFGALISPTDPIAVLGLLKKLGAPKGLATKIAGESLFNDGVGIVVFLALCAVAGLSSGGEQAVQHADISALEIAKLFAQETLGGAVFGLGIGFLAYRMIKSVDQYQVELIITLALVTGGYALAQHWHLSGPIAMVVAGLLIGNQGRRLAMSDTTRQNLDTFWELVDEVLNALLFLLVGLEVLIVSKDLQSSHLWVGLLAIPITLLARFLAVGIGVAGLGKVRSFTPHVVKVLTWGGLRGGISIALVLNLKSRLGPGEASEIGSLLLVMTYGVVIFSICFQGLTLGALLRRWGLTGKGAE